MDFKNVKLVVVDMDGTLLNSNHEVSDLFFELYEKLKSLDILFVAASGRPYYSIIEKLDSIKDDIIIAAENGAYVVDDNKTILSTPINAGDLPELIKTINSYTDIHPVYCTKDKAYVKSKSKSLLKILSQYYNQYEIIDFTDVIEKEVYKIALYHEVDSEKHIYPHLKYLESSFKVIVSAAHWVDISRIDANKGQALKLIQEKYNIKPEETMAFGDYKNDIEMLDLANFSFAMKNAHPEVKGLANFETKTNDENGVEFILRKLIEAKS